MTNLSWKNIIKRKKRKENIDKKCSIKLPKMSTICWNVYRWKCKTKNSKVAE